MAKQIFSFLLSVSACFSAAAQNTSNDSLIAGAVHADSLFWEAYNRCDVQKMMGYIAHDIEFYHDKGGITLGDSALGASIKNGLCSNQEKYRLRRAEVSGTGKAYPMMKNDKVYGVLMAGKHLFYLSQNGEKEHADGLAQYADLWLLKNGEWKMSRVFSYDHGPAPHMSNRKAIMISRKNLQVYAGNYEGPNTMLTVSLKGDSLTVPLGNSAARLFAEKENLFFIKERDLTFEFLRENNRLTKMVVRENGKIVEELIRTKH
jgi:hypothetical protein